MTLHAHRQVSLCTVCIYAVIYLTLNYLTQADVNQLNRDGCTPLTLASTRKQNKEDAVKALIEAKADANSPSQSPLFVAVGDSDADKVRLVGVVPK